MSTQTLNDIYKVISGWDEQAALARISALTSDEKKLRSGTMQLSLLEMMLIGHQNNPRFIPRMIALVQAHSAEEILEINPDDTHATALLTAIWGGWDKSVVKAMSEIVSAAKGRQYVEDIIRNEAANPDFYLAEQRTEPDLASQPNKNLGG